MDKSCNPFLREIELQDELSVVRTPIYTPIVSLQFKALPNGRILQFLTLYPLQFQPLPSLASLKSEFKYYSFIELSVINLVFNQVLGFREERNIKINH